MGRGGFSLRRAAGISGARSNFSKMVGIPTTKSGRQQKIGRTASQGCLVTLIALMVPVALLLLIIIL